jgi:biopolymer transport protein ExbB
MINTFDAIGQQTKQGNVKGVAGGADKIGLALFATAMGLFTAIPLVFSHVLFKDWINRFEVKIKVASQRLVTLVTNYKKDPALLDKVMELEDDEEEDDRRTRARGARRG